MDEKILREAEFDRRVIPYWLTTGVIVCLVTVIGIAFLPVWLIIGSALCGKYLRRMSGTLSDKSLVVKKGMLNRIEKTIPLEKITDLALFQGPIMRAFGIDGLRVETAGQSSGPGALVTLVGVVEARAFRDAVLAQREIATGGSDRETAGPSKTEPSESVESLLGEIRELARQIEQNTRGS